MYRSTNSTLRHQILLEALRIIQTQAMTVSWLQLVTGDCRGAAIFNVLSVSQVSSQLYHCHHHHHHRRHHDHNAVILKTRNSAMADKPRDAFADAMAWLTS